MSTNQVDFASVCEFLASNGMHCERNLTAMANLGTVLASKLIGATTPSSVALSDEDERAATVIVVTRNRVGAAARIARGLEKLGVRVEGAIGNYVCGLYLRSLLITGSTASTARVARWLRSSPSFFGVVEILPVNTYTLSFACPAHRRAVRSILKLLRQNWLDIRWECAKAPHVPQNCCRYLFADFVVVAAPTATANQFDSVCREWATRFGGSADWLPGAALTTLSKPRKQNHAN